MSVHARTLRTIRTIGATVIGWIIAVFLGIWAIAESPFDPDHFVESILAGIVAGVVTYTVEHSPALLAATRKLSAGRIVIVRTAIYTFLITFFVLLVSALRAPFVRGLDPFDIFSDEKFHTFLFGGQFYILLAILLVTSFTISFLREVHRMFGPGLLLKLMLGTYHRPIEENRIFMFLDLNESTTIAEKLGPIRFAEFKNDFFHDLAGPVLETRGEVVQYVGDEVVLTWKTERGVRDANWLRCFFLIREKITAVREEYLRRYGMSPAFKAGCHSGVVVTTEVGDLKRGIAHSGDTVNTAARIEGECRRLSRDFLVSETLYRRTTVPENVEATDMGEVLLRGKSEALRLWSVDSMNGV
jgi:adenylate cyclase